MPSVKWLILWSLWAMRHVRQPGRVVRVTGGEVRGNVARDGSHISYYGIPYATVEKRFQRAQPAKWDGILESTNDGVRCTQRFGKGWTLGQEDCLTINVYTPLQKSDSLLPVMFFIHGGGFRDGSASPMVYGPEYLVRHGVLLVTFNYRLEILGFLCLGIKEAPGNAGIKDQVEALKWVKSNIRQFGGDPDDVTIFGESAGAAAVIYHLTSPMSKGYFHKAIAQSGSAISPWAIQINPLEIAIKVVKQMGYNMDDPLDIYNLLAEKSAEELLWTRIPREEGNVILSENVFVPCIESKVPGEEPFLSEHPYNLLKQGNHVDIPIMIGFNNAEGYMFVAKENDTTLSKLDINKAFPSDLEFPSEEIRNKTASKAKELYLGSKEISKKTILDIAKFEGDTGITYSTLVTVDMLLENLKSRLYTYKFSFDTWMNIVKIYMGYGKAPGAGHADELFYLFKPSFYLLQAYSNRYNIEKMTTLWTNFAKFGEPTPETSKLLPLKWPPTDKREPLLLVIDENLSIEPLWNDPNLLFWKSVYSKYRRKS